MSALSYLPGQNEDHKYLNMKTYVDYYTPWKQEEKKKEKKKEKEDQYA